MSNKEIDPVSFAKFNKQLGHCGNFRGLQSLYSCVAGVVSLSVPSQ